MFCSLAAARRRLGVATGALLAVGVLAVPAGALAGVNADPGVYGDLYRMPSAPMPAPAPGADVTRQPGLCCRRCDDLARPIGHGSRAR